MAEDGNTGGDSAPGSRGEGDSNGHPVRQVVNAVTQDDHPGHAGHVAGGGVEVGVGVSVTVVRNLTQPSLSVRSVGGPLTSCWEMITFSSLLFFCWSSPPVTAPACRSATQ